MSIQRRHFASEDDEARYHLDVLRDGTREEVIEARERLSRIFERRGQVDEALELLETNVAQGHRTPQVYEDLARLYRAGGNGGRALKAHAEAKQLRASLARASRRAGLSGARRRAGRAAILEGVGLICFAVLVTIGSVVLALSGVLPFYFFVVPFGGVILSVISILRGLAVMFPRDLRG